MHMNLILNTHNISIFFNNHLSVTKSINVLQALLITVYKIFFVYLKKMYGKLAVPTFLTKKKKIVWEVQINIIESKYSTFLKSPVHIVGIIQWNRHYSFDRMVRLIIFFNEY